MCFSMQFASKSWKFESKASSCIDPFGIGDACDDDCPKLVVLGCSTPLIFLGGGYAKDAWGDDHFQAIV